MAGQGDSQVSRRWLALGALVAATLTGAALLVARPWASEAGRTFTARGTLYLMGSTDDTDEHPVIAVTDDNSCYGALQYGDLDWSSPVAVLDRSAKLGTSSLSEGVIVDGGCRFTFSVKDVPTGRTSYALKITDRAPYTFTMGQLERGVSIRIGL